MYLGTLEVNCWFQKYSTIHSIIARIIVGCPAGAAVLARQIVQLGAPPTSQDQPRGTRMAPSVLWRDLERK
jgi:hypothetical protein